MISILVPSRDRTVLLERSVDSLRSRALHPYDVQIVVAADEDDPATISKAQQLHLDCAVTSQFGYEGLHRYYQLAADLAIGDWLMVWNDDAVMYTPYWDQVIEHLPAEVLIADIQTNHSPLCCYPAIRRCAIEVLGRFSTANPHVDTCWQDIGHRTGTIRSVNVHAMAETPVKPGQTHGYYESAHQAELDVATETIREAFCAGNS